MGIEPKVDNLPARLLARKGEEISEICGTFLGLLVTIFVRVDDALG
jgi:hypothetical protein